MLGVRCCVTLALLDSAGGLTGSTSSGSSGTNGQIADFFVDVDSVVSTREQANRYHATFSCWVDTRFSDTTKERVSQSKRITAGLAWTHENLPYLASSAPYCFETAARGRYHQK